MENFRVRTKTDWQAVSEWLFNRAMENPAQQKDVNLYSKTEEEAWDKTEKLISQGKAEEATSNTAVVDYRGQHVLTVVLTKEPGSLHLSIGRVTSLGMKAVPDAVATEAAREILGMYQERKEGVMQVRHFYQEIA